MPVKSVQHPITKRIFKFGRRRPVARGPRLSLKNYLTRSLPTAPAASDYTAAASSALSQMYDNDTLGDCVIAGMAHVVGVMTGNAGESAYVYNNSQIVGLYSAICGYVAGDSSTDNGCDMQTAMNYWENNGAMPPYTTPAGVDAHHIAGWLAVNGADPQEYRAALWLFENLYFGMELPDAWINPAPSDSGFVWDVAGDSDPNNGHCVAGVGYNSQGVVIDTWGMTGLLTDAAIAKYATKAANGELYTVVSTDAINNATQKAPSGFDWSQLIADFDSMGGNVSSLTKQSRPAGA
jgi:hypothetical protein